MNNEPWYGPLSNWSLQEIRKLPIETFVQFLIEWTPQPKDDLRPYASMEGTGRNIQADVYEDPERYTRGLHLFQQLAEPTYIRHILSGFRIASLHKIKFNWAPVLDLCDWAVKKNIYDVLPKNQHEIKWNQDPDWKPTRHQIASLLSSGLAQKVDEGGIPFSEKERVWWVISQIIQTSEMDKDLLDLEKDDNFNVYYCYSYAMDDCFAAAIECSIQYALWVRRHLEESQAKTSEQLTHEGFSNFEEVKNVLNQYLDKPASLSLHSIYGRFFPWLYLLDPEWAKLAIVKIFPKDKELKKYSKVAWFAYISNCHPYNKIFNSLKGLYEEEIRSNKIVSGEIKEKFDCPVSSAQNQVKRELIEHIVNFYFNGLIALNDNILDLFVSRACEKSLKDAMRVARLIFKYRKGVKNKRKLLYDFLKKMRNQITYLRNSGAHK